jgi:uncharacterized protein (DUF342 family)
MDADAAVRFGSTRDRMKVGVSRYTPAQGQGRPLSVELLAKALAEAGIVVPLDQKNAAEAVALLLAGKDASRIVLARGVRPTLGRDAWVDPVGDWSLPVFPGMAFGRLHPARLPADGMDVAGNPVPPETPHKPREIAPAPDGSCMLSEDGELFAQIYGLARVTDTQVLVEPLVRIPEDRLSATVTLHPRDAQGAAVTLERVLDALSRQRVVFGVQEDNLAEGVGRVGEQNSPLSGVLAARGHPPQHGSDGRLERFYSVQTSVGIEDESGRMNYRDRGEFPVVEQGRDVARLHPPTKGVPGRNIHGEVVPARDGATLTVRPGKNVEVLEEGRLLRARITGAVVAQKNALDVSELLGLNSDVDIATGDIRLTQGSVQIKGAVRTGFTVRAPDDVFVEGEVESARIVAGGDVVVRGGIFMSGGEAAFVQAEGSVTAAYTHNALVQAGGDVTITLCITCSKVRAGFKVSSGGFVRILDQKGRIMGGAVVCAEGLETFEAGSVMGVSTTLALSHESTEARALVEEKRELKAFLTRVLPVFGEGDGAAALAGLSAERKAEAEELLAKRDDAKRRLAQITRSLAELAQEELAQSGRARIIVRGVAHPGVVVKMGGKALHLDRPVVRSQFYWDAEKREIAVGGL